MGDLDGTIADYSLAIALDPSNADAYISRGEAKEAKGDFVGSNEDFSIGNALHAG